MLDAGIIDYLGSFWNVNDLVMIILTWTYCSLRLGTEKYRGGFLLIRNIEFNEEHLETEIALK